MSNATCDVFGVKTTLNRLAVKLEFFWHGLSDLDSIKRSPIFASAVERRENMDRKVTRGDKNDVLDHMLMDF